MSLMIHLTKDQNKDKTKGIANSRSNGKEQIFKRHGQILPL